ncbi:hypothetical protein PENSPDRAFT_631155 [Peniophora sp. CONT]|nr:hypothetical protein PENSPDRAFT_631155 [Peniophora sp. CONT]
MFSNPRSSRTKGSLSKKERVWVFLYDFLLGEGYRLRARYQPGWKPSRRSRILAPICISRQQVKEEYEDLLPILGKGETIDATRIADGKSVWLKYMPSSSTELAILRATSLSECRADCRNHCVPLLDVLDFCAPGIGERWWSIAVMPMLRTWYDPPPHLFVEVVPFIDQLLEGLAFLHDMNTTHGDIKGNNIMMNADSMYPDGFNALVVGRGHRSVALKDATPRKSRLDAPVTYTYIDFEFGHSFRSDEEPRLVRYEGGVEGMPEMYEVYGDRNSARTRPYDPFKADIWALGHSLMVYFNDSCIGRFPVILPLLNSMVHRDPHLRPPAAECLRMFREIVVSLSWILCCRLPPLRLVSWGSSRRKMRKTERLEEKEYLECLEQSLSFTGGRPRLLKHMSTCQ